ncbi:glutaredoxin family protein [Brevibacillus sp. H7]|jgi:glutaredoxin|uniref:glutaredoxin family protein n=1 Tax=Brevibacillus sp. H7 TaxID=3349138 RepID=UPI0037FDFDB6
MHKRPFNIVLYGRPGCHLCDQVEERIRRVGREYPLAIQVVNIESDAHLHERYMLTIPVVEIDGEEAFLSVASIMTEEQFRRELAKRSHR